MREWLFARDNPFLPGAVLAACLLGLAALYVPFLQYLRSVLGTAQLAWCGVDAGLGAGTVGCAVASTEGLLARRAQCSALGQRGPVGLRPGPLAPASHRGPG